MEPAELKAAFETTLKEKPEAINEILPVILETEKAKEIISNKAEAIYKEKITTEVSAIHSQYDNDMFEILGEKPSKLDDGSKQKTYDKIKGLYGELKELREKKDSLSKDEAVKSLQAKIAELEKNGPGAHWEQTFKAEQEKWTQEKNSLMGRLEEKEKGMVDFKKKSDIESGLRGFKFRNDIPESARQALINLAVDQLVKNSKVEDGKVLYLNESGAVINNSEYKPESAKGVLSTLLKDIIKNEDQGGGGGAPRKITGSIEAQTIDGKEVQKLVLDQTQFKTKREFVEVAESAMLKSGIARGDSNWDKLKNEAYMRYQVTNMPR
jgi:FtsZ-binding cell division protein ZapB